MAVEEYFSWEWKELASKSCLYVAPRETADDQRWIAFFKEVAGTFRGGEAFVFVDVRGIEEKISFEGFEGIIDVFKGQGIKTAIFAVITTDELHSMMADLFQELADTSDFKLQIDVFLHEGSARSWMVERIG